jgi:hypothetical protein
MSSPGIRPSEVKRDLGGIGSRPWVRRLRYGWQTAVRDFDQSLGGFWEVALALLAAVLGVPGWLDKPWWVRPFVLGSIVVVGIYGKGRTERTGRERSQEERMAFATTARDLFREERERDAAKRDRDAEAEEVEALEAEVAALAAEEQE